MSELIDTIQKVFKVANQKYYDKYVYLNNSKNGDKIFLKEVLDFYTVEHVYPQNNFFEIKILEKNSKYFKFYTYNDLLLVSYFRDFYMPYHRHDYVELVYVVSGKMKQRIADEEIILEEGQFCIIDQNCMHQELITSDDMMVLYLSFSKEFFEFNFENTNDMEELQIIFNQFIMGQKKMKKYVFLRPYDHYDDIEVMLTTILQEYYNRNIGYQYMIKVLSMRLFQVLCQKYDLIFKSKDSIGIHENFFYILNQYIKGNLEKVSISDLQDRFHYGRNYFTKVIKENTGLTYTEYLKVLRMDETKKLLIETDLSVSDIALRVGINNRSYFYTLFNEFYNMSPVEYRKKYSV